MGSELTTVSAAATAPATLPADQTAREIRVGQFFLQRFQRFLVLRAAPRLPPAGRRLIDHALYSTYWDSVALGLRAEVTAALDAASEQEPSPGGPT